VHGQERGEAGARAGRPEQDLEDLLAVAGDIDRLGGIRRFQGSLDARILFQ